MFFAASSSGVPALRAHTSHRYWPGVVGVHGRLVAALHSCLTVHPVDALYTHHLNCTGAVPPIAAAVSVIIVPGVGRASGRESVEIPVVGGSVKEKDRM